MPHDIYQTVTDTIIKQLESGAPVWRKQWNAGKAGMPTRHNGEQYSGINVLLLWSAAMERNYTSRYWMTFKQAQQFGANVRRGEHGEHIVYADRFVKRETDDAGNENVRSIPFLKSYVVFNADQIEGLPAKYLPESAGPELQESERIAHAETWVASTGADIRHGGGAAFYVPSQDYVQMTEFKAFHDALAYYGTLAHELTHWSGAKSRLGREYGKRFGDETYAAEELVAEIGAAFICGRLGLENVAREDHAAYVANWLKILNGDKRAIFTAASMAEKAADYLIDGPETLAIAA